MKTTKVTNLPRNIQSNQELIQEALDLGCVKAKVIPTKTIALARWLRLQCQYGCPHFGTRLTCPPFSPMADETSELLLDYAKALLIQASCSDAVRDIVLRLEDNLKKKGFYKAFALGAKTCDLCEACTVDTHCEFPEKARPSLRAFGIDIPKTILDNGWSLAAPPDYCNGNHPIGMVLID
jgi:predicted metal-binding protein